MDLNRKILSKSEINDRFVTAVFAVLANNLISSKTGLAESLGVKPAKFSEILNGRMNAGVDMIAIMCDRYKVSPDWLLMSRGTELFRTGKEPAIIVDEDKLNKEFPGFDDGQVKPDNHAEGASDALMSLIREKDAIIREQAEEIGRLRERLESRGDDASSATDLAPARVG